MRFASRLILLAAVVSLAACARDEDPNTNTSTNADADRHSHRYFDNRSRDDVLSGGVKMIPIETSKGTFHVWTKRVGNNPRIKILTLHGGPAATHEYMEAFESFFPKEGFEFYEYDQLGSYYSEQPKDSSLWTIEHFVDEVAQVRKAIGADASNFYVFGNSWGGMLAMEYALK